MRGVSLIHGIDYNLPLPFLSNISFNVRKRIFKQLKSYINFSSLEHVLDIGVTSYKDNAESNFFEKLFPYPEKIVALSKQNASWLEKEYNGLKFIYGDGCKLPFNDNTFDLVFSSAVIEHTGSNSQQQSFINECYRVSKKYVFLTTPNRWHPLEFHSLLPLIHWLPKPLHRKLLNLLGYKQLSQEQHLNLLSTKELKKFCNHLQHIYIYTNHVKFLGFPSNILLYLEKNVNC